VSDQVQDAASLSPSKRRLLELLLRKEQQAAAVPIPRRQPDETAPLSFAQERLWFLEQLEPLLGLYNMAAAWRLEGELDLPVLERSLEELVRRHESLRTVFPVRNGVPVQEVRSSAGFRLLTVDLTTLPPAAREAEARRQIETEFRRPCDLAAGPLFRAHLLRVDAGRHLLLLTTHHTVSDGWSHGVIQRELGALYAAFQAGRASPLPEPVIQYADYAAWHRRSLSEAELARQVSYWKEHLTGAPAQLELPTDRPRPPLQTYAGAVTRLELPRELILAVGEVAQRAGATPFMVLLATFHLLLARYSGQADVVVGTPVANRPRTELESVVGLFANTLAIRLNLAGDPDFLGLLDRMRTAALGAYAHQETPFEKIVEALRPERDFGTTPIFQVLFALQNTHSERLSLPGLHVEPFPFEEAIAKFDLSLFLWQDGDRLLAELKYNSDLFDVGRMERLLGHYRTLLQGITATPASRLSELPLLTENEQRVLAAWNDDTAASYPQHLCLHDLVRQQALRTPDATAVQMGSEARSYAELEALASRVAQVLRRHGVGSETCVGVCLERGPEMVAGLLGILKAGGAYVPLDPAWPRQRLDAILQGSAPALVLTESRLADLVPEGPPRLLLDRLEFAGDSEEPQLGAGDPEGLAYVLHTSGSTGAPKGVEVSHRAVVNFLCSMAQRPGFTAADTLLAVTTLSFDISVLELFLPLIVGGRVVIAGADEATDGERLATLISGSDATVMQATPATWRLLFEAGWSGAPGLKVLCGGEALPEDLADLLRARCGELWNMYGPTETTVWSTCADLTEDGPVHVGTPIANTRIYVLDRARRPVPMGVTGALYIGGAGLARGYRGRPELTAERFLPDPFSDEAGARMYHTGDLAQLRADGSLLLLGRLDHQVKLRGFRIELGEIELALRQHPRVADAVVTLQRSAAGELLAAYVVPAGEPPPAVELRDWLRASLPEYMLPAAWAFLEALPLTSSGKIARNALPSPTLAGVEATPALARDGVEASLLEVWRRVLPGTPLGVRDSFFDLGGHSLLAVRLLSQVRKEIGVDVTLAAFLRAPTIEGMARALKEGGARSGWQSVVPLQSAGSLRPFFAVHGIGGGVACFRDLAQLLGPRQPVYGLQAISLGGADREFDEVAEMAAHYIREMRSVQPQGPYRLGGFSFGGIIALEMAHQLLQAGEEVALLALLDTRAPGYPRFAGTGARIAAQLKGFTSAEPAQRGQFVRARVKSTFDYLRRRVLVRAYFRERAAGIERALADIGIAHLRAAHTYRCRPYPGRITLFRAEVQPLGCVPDPYNGWGPLAEGGVEVHCVSGEHATLVSQPHVQELARKLGKCLEREDC
jgi:amino acid adenylation domain-containing protein